ncbi:MAG: DUF2344 domain-containing protein [Chloroflexi bacterium]|nr:DUF2344 domain-containing protein [Chloroflexota bacterium]
MSGKVIQRLRVRFARGPAVKYVSHLDIMRLWQRALNRAGIPLAYSEGFTPHPRLSLAAPLAVGVVSEAELMDVELSKRVTPTAFTSLVGAQLPEGFDILQVLPVALTLPSLQSQVRFAEYEVEVETTQSRQEVESAITALLAKNTLPWQHLRDTGVRHYDLRLLIDDLWLADWQSGRCRLGMNLVSDSRGSGRPEQVALALGFAGYPVSIKRTRLALGAG